MAQPTTTRSLPPRKYFTDSPPRFILFRSITLHGFVVTLSSAHCCLASPPGACLTPKGNLVVIFNIVVVIMPVRKVCHLILVISPSSPLTTSFDIRAHTIYIGICSNLKRVLFAQTMHGPFQNACQPTAPRQARPSVAPSLRRCICWSTTTHAVNTHNAPFTPHTQV